MGFANSGTDSPLLPVAVSALGRLADHGYRRVFSATTDQVAAARRFLADLLGGHPATDDAILCLGELAANAVRHSHSARPGGTFAVRLCRSGAAIRVEVTDLGGPWKINRPGDAERGRGLTIVLELSDRRGIISHRSGERTVWYEIEPR